MSVNIRCRGSGMWDSDEMLVTLNGTLESVLRRYEAYGAVVVNWRMFGSSGHMKR